MTTEELQRKLAEHERLAAEWKGKSFPVYEHHAAESKRLRAMLPKPVQPLTTETSEK